MTTSNATSEKLRWGILGAARVNERLLPAIAQGANCQLVGIASRRPNAATETLAKYAPPGTTAQVYPSLDALLGDETIQAIYLPLANHEHAEWTLRAIEHGKHVLCEKPMALHPQEIDAIANAAARRGVKVMEGFMYRFHPQHQRVMALLESGLIGEIRSVRASYSFMMRPARLYRLAEPITRGGGAMWDIGCYAIHSLRWFFKEAPRQVVAVAKYVASGADSAASGVIDFGEGRFGHFDFSFERARRCEYELIGTQGGLKCHIVWQLPGDVPIISWWTEDGRYGEERLPPANHFQLEVEHFSACVLEDRAPALSLEDAKLNCLTINAAIRAAAEKRLVSLAECA